MIFTIDARDNIYFDVLVNHFKLSRAETYENIQYLFDTMVQALDAKGISYHELRNALVPSLDRIEVGFIFDSSEIQEAYYEGNILSSVLPLLDRRSKHCILRGDLLCIDQKTLIETLKDCMILSRSFQFKHGSLLYCVYINNLTEEAFHRLKENLPKHPAYVGYIPTQFSSYAKTYLSTTVGTLCVKDKNRIILPHEDDAPNDENYNITLFDFERLGFDVFSIQETYFNLFLSYKIERAVFEGFEDDTDISLNSITDKVLPINDFDIEIAEAKYSYLQKEKKGKFCKAGIANLTLDKLKVQILEKINSSYIYNMEFLSQHNAFKFCIMLEVKNEKNIDPTRLIAVFEYKPDQKILRLITLY